MATKETREREGVLFQRLVEAMGRDESSPNLLALISEINGPRCAAIIVVEHNAHRNSRSEGKSDKSDAIRCDVQFPRMDSKMPGGLTAAGNCPFG